ncbi:MAG: ABC transporter permease [Bacilli bacterium]|nr:ABC transporter permease [Bacilli bacterium]
MRSKLNFLINVSLKKKIKSKWFLVANIVIGLLIVGLINLDSIITKFGGDFSDSTKIYISDETTVIAPTFEEALNLYVTNLYGMEESKYEVEITDKKSNEMQETIKDEENKSLLIEIYYDENNDIKAKLISLSTLDTYDYQIISGALNTTTSMYTLSSIGLTEEQYNKILKGIEIDRVILDESIKTEDENMEMIVTTVFPIIILPFFMLTIFLIQFIGTEVNDEKSTKSMEIIISNVSPKTHFASKIIANNLFILMQVVLMIIYAMVGIGIRKVIGGDNIINGIGTEVSNMFNMILNGSLGEKLVPIIIFTIILMILTFIAYSLLAGILASMTTNAEDYQQVQGPMVIILLIGYYLSMIAGMFEGSVLIKILSFFPFVSAILSPSLLVMGQIGVVEIIISTIIMIITNYLLIKYGIRIYKVGILNYSSTGMWKKMFKSLRNK